MTPHVHTIGVRRPLHSRRSRSRDRAQQTALSQDPIRGQGPQDCKRNREERINFNETDSTHVKNLVFIFLFLLIITVLADTGRRVITPRAREQRPKINVTLKSDTFEYTC